MRLSTEPDPDDARAIAGLHAALDAGVTLLDTANGSRLTDRPVAVLLLVVSVFGLSFLFTWIWSHAGHRLFPVVVAQPR